jgi:Flp pilus assembly pilin Flp
MLKIFTALQLRLMDLRDREEGQTFAEYGLILAVIALVAVVTAITLGGNIADKFTAISTELTK